MKENVTYQNLCDAKTVLIEKLVALKVYTGKRMVFKSMTAPALRNRKRIKETPEKEIIKIKP